MLALFPLLPNSLSGSALRSFPLRSGSTLATPLEQFEVLTLPAGPALLGWVTNAAEVLAAFGLLHLLLGGFLFGGPRLVGGGWLQSFGEALVRSLGDFVVANGGRALQGHLPLLLPLGLLLTAYNLGGLLPFGYTVSAHLLATFFYGFGLFFGLNWVAIARYGGRFLAIFLPAGIGLGLAPLLVPIELVSYLFKPVSLSVRLFANMLAGHALLKILLSFAFGALSGGALAAAAALLGLGLVGAILLLEFMVALLQVFVFLTLTVLYLAEVHRTEH
jgi:ATP synthase subunit 6